MRRKLTGSIVPIEALDGTTRAAMWTVFARHYAGADRTEFERDLAEKNHVILLRDAIDGTVQGMSTLKVYTHHVAGRPIVAIFSGDTIVDPRYWGQSALHWAFWRYLAGVKLRHPSTPVYWFLISKGYKTYLLLARNFPTHWPRHDRPTPSLERAVIGSLASDRYGEAYNPQRGVVEFEVPSCRLRDQVAPISDDMLADPQIRFFRERNPGHERGHELCCIGQVDVAFFWRGLVRTLSRRKRKPERR